MNTLIVSTFDCSFEDFDKFVADFHEKEGHKYVEEYELIKVNEHKSHLILKLRRVIKKRVLSLYVRSTVNQLIIN